MNKSSKLLFLIVTVFLVASSIQVECRRTYSSRSSSSGRGNRGKNQPSGGLFSSWFGGSKTSSSGSGSISKPAPTSAKKNWQTASSHATSQSKPSSGWANPYYKPTGSGSAPVPSAPKETSYGWKPATGINSKPVSSYPSSNIGSRGYPVQTGVQQGSQSSFGGYKPASGVPGSTHYQPASGVPGSTHYQPASGVPGSTHYQPSQTGIGGYRPASNVPSTGYHPSGYQTGHSAPSYHPSQGYQPSHGAPHQPSFNPTGGHYSSGYPQQPGLSSGGYHAPSYTGYSSHSSFGGAAPSYQGTKLFGSNSGHYGYPGSGSWGIDTYGTRKSSGTGKLLTGLAVGAAGGYLTSSLINRVSNPWKYSGYGYGVGSPLGLGLGYGGGYGGGYGSGYDAIRVRDESAFERGYERGIQAKLNENQSDKTSNKEAPAPEPEDPTSKWIQCVAFDPQTQQTLINPNCSCTVTTSTDERTGQPLSVHHCTTLNGLVMRPIPIQPGVGAVADANGQPLRQPEISSGPSVGGASGQSFGSVDVPPAGGINTPQAGGSSLGGAPSYFPIAYGDDFQYNGGATVYIPPRAETKLVQAPIETKPDAITDKSTTESKTKQSATEPKPEQSTTGTNSETSPGTVTEQQVTARIQNIESVTGGSKSEAPPVPEELGGDGGGNQKRTAEFFGRLQKIVNMGNFVDGG